MHDQPTPAIPAPTKDIEQAVTDLAEHGLCIVSEALQPTTLARVRKAMYHAADDDLERGRVKPGFALDKNDNNQRVWNLLNRDSIFSDLAEHPIALRLVRETLGWPALLSNISGNITRPGAIEGVLHADQIFVPQPWPDQPQGINVLWCIDDFTAENGATEVVLDSHRLHRSPSQADEPITTTPLIASAGTVFAFESRLWHRSGANTSTNQTRAGVFPFYSTPIYRTQENWFLSLDPSVRDNASDTLLTLLAYKSEGFGTVYGESPI
ncbi:MAG: ectoine hydroxylase-related dioxygenase (phytanoyl-CoA dioxygenase family) [Limisphaerales bacterium]|jgi:ectoine hydroxylase-related dioxygenase (phytanoyl-CoA dioxygenase family)